MTEAVLNLEIPKMDGSEVLRRLRADPRTRLLPVVILTSSQEEWDLIEGYRGKLNSYLRKPVDYTRFVDPTGETVRQMIARQEEAGLQWGLFISGEGESEPHTTHQV